jgi:hypothetical protein
MAGVLHIEGKTLGKKKPLFADWSVPLPPELADDGDGDFTLRRLIAHLVRREVASFRERQEQRRLARVLSTAEIERGVERGKIDSGGRDLKQTVDEEQAVAAAWEAFEDGIYLVVIDGRQHRELDAPVFLRPESRVTFLRLVMLAGG